MEYFRIESPAYLLSLVTLAVLLACEPAGEQLEVSNVLPRLDQVGQIVDAHDGRVIQFGERFYWYGTAYGNTSGFTSANRYVCYSSDDLQTWQFEGLLLADPPEGVYYRPHVVYHAKSEQYILWYNWYPVLWEGQFGVALSDRPEGPFRIVNADVQMKHSDIGLGDFGLFVDGDQTAFLAYNTIHNHQVSVEKLTPDYLGSTQENSGFIAQYCEAGSMFKRMNTYYLLTDFTCCFCGQGSGARVYMADNPLGPFEQHGNINRYPGIPQPQLTDGVFERFGTLLMEKGDSLLVEFDGAPASTISLQLAWENHRTHCRPDDTAYVHPDPVIPMFSLFSGSEKMELSPTVENKYNRLNLSYTFPSPLEEDLLIRLDSSIFATRLAEIATADGTDPEAFLLNRGRPPIIPAQQTHIMELITKSGVAYIWMGDLWGSRPDNIKGHDQQYWSAPLQFRSDGTIERMSWTDAWQVQL